MSSTAPPPSTNGSLPQPPPPTTTSLPTTTVDPTPNLEPEPETQPDPPSVIPIPIPAADGTTVKWPGWPGECVFRLIVPVLKVGSIIGRKGDIIKKMCEETKARIRVLDPTNPANPDRIVLISGKEELELPLSPAMVAVIRIFRRINGFPENESESLASVPFCSVRLLVPSMQAISLIGKQGLSIKAIQEGTGCSVRVLSGDEVSAVSSNADERIVDMQGEAVKVLKALEAVVGHLRKFLVDRSVLPLFEKPNNAVTPVATQEHQVETSWAEKAMMRTSAPQSHLGPSGIGDYSLPMRRETLFAPSEPQRESHLTSHGLSLYGRDPGLPTTLSPAVPRTGGPVVTQVAQTMQIPLIYAEDIIGVGGTNIAYIRRTSGAILTVQESRGLPDEITVEIKGTASQVQTAQQLIQECVNGHKEASIQSSYGNLDSGLRSSYSQLGNPSYPPSSSAYGPSSFGGYGASGLGGYSGSYRM